MKNEQTMNEENYIIYKATNKVDNKTYIGATTRDLEQRKTEHIQQAYNIDKDNSQVIERLKVEYHTI